MRTSKEKQINFITLVLITLLTLPILCFSLGNNKGINTSWFINPKVDSSTNAVTFTNSVILSVDEAVHEIYLYVGNVYNAPNNKIEIILDSSDSQSSIKQGDYFSPNRKIFSIDVKKGEYLGWVKLGLNSTITSTYIKLGTKQSFELFEVGFTGKDGVVVPAKCFGGITWANTYKFISADSVKDGFVLVADEQDAFSPKKGINTLTESEISLAGAVDNLINFKGGYVSHEHNVLGVLFTAIGISIFGNSPFGLRIVGFLFFLATLYLLFFIAKKIFTSNTYAVITVILYLLSGLSLSLVTHSNPITITIFFVLASFYSALIFANKATDSKSIRKHANYLVLCGFTFALALCVSVYALFVLPAILFTVLYPSIKGIVHAYKDYNEAEGLEKEYAREKYRKTLSRVIVNSIIGFAVMPVLLLVISYGIAYPTYTAFFESNLISAIFKNHSRIFASQSNGLFAGWVIGLGSKELSSAFAGSYHLVANRAFALISSLSLLAIGVMYIRNKMGRILSGALIVALRENKKIYFSLLAIFACSWLGNLFFWGTNDYINFAITLTFATLSTVLLYKLLNTFMKKRLLRVLTVIILTVIVLFFALHTTAIFNYDLPKDFQPIYVWLF